MQKIDAVKNSISKNNVSAVTLCLGLTFGMLGMSFAAVPLYKIFCQVTGYGGTTQRADAASDIVLKNSINVRFDANISTDLDWEFAPKQRQVTIQIGENKQISYFAKNLGSETSYGRASFNVSPGIAGAYFNKMECFCFTEQKLAPGESIEMPVVFFVDPEIANDPLLKDTKTITLSYTFFTDEDAEEEARVSQAKPEQAVGEKTKSSL